MRELRIYADDQPQQTLERSTDPAEITGLLNAAGIRFEQWQTRDDIAAGDDAEAVLAAYEQDVQRLVDEQGYQSVDVISLNASNPAKDELRQKFLSEHRAGVPLLRRLRNTKPRAHGLHFGTECCGLFGTRYRATHFFSNV